MSGRHHSIIGTGPLSSANPLPPPPSVHPPSLSHQQSHPHALPYHPHHQSPASINAKAQSRPPTGRSPMMRGAVAGNGGPAGSGASVAEREREAYYRSEAYHRDREVREREKERERERDRERERGRDRDRDRERERDPRDRMRERDRDYGRDREQQVARSQQHQQQQQHINGHGPPPFHPNGHHMSHSGPTTRHPLDMSHGHASSHLPPPPQPSGPSSAIDRRESRNHPPPPLAPHHHHHQVQNMRTSSMGPNSQGMPGPSGGPAGLTAAQVSTAIVKGTEGPLQALAQANEQTWLLIGAVSEQLSDTTRALIAYENALRHNPMSVSALTQVAGIARSKEEFAKAIDYYQRTLNISPENGEVWGSLGHCYLMTDDLQKAYTAYQQALYRLPNPKDSKLWYGIGILYDRYGSLEHAEEAFSSVLRMEPDFEKANEIYFRLGIIYKQQHKYPASLDCFRYILGHPPRPLTEVDIWFQIGHVYEQQKDYGAAKDAYERVLKDSPNHAKVLQQLGWLYHQGGASFANQDLAISYLTKSLEADPADPQSWYLLGRAFMGGQKFNKAYEAYQQAVYRDGRNPTFWCSIGVLYYQINQYRDALDAYSRAIRLNPFISEVWFDLGSLYESCNNQVNDAIDAYARASDLDPNNVTVKSRLSLLKNAQRDGQPLPPPPPPQDVHPTAYASTVPGGRFPGQGGPGGPPPYEGPSVGAGPDGQPILTGRDLAAPPPPQMASLQESAFRGGGGPPPLQLDDVRNPAVQRTPLAPMTVDRTPNNEAAHSRAQSQAQAGPGPEGHERRRGGRMSPPPLQLRGEGRPVAGSHPDLNGWDPYYRRDAGDDRDPRDPRGARIDKLSGTAGASASLRGSPAPSAVRGSPSVMRSYPSAPSPWDSRHESSDRRTPMQDNADRRVSGEYRQAGPLNGLGKRSSISQLPHPDDARAGSQSRPASPNRHAMDDKYRSDRAYRESDARARDELERRPRYSPEPPTSASLLTRPDASSMQSPASAHSVAVPESTKKKRGKARATSPDKQSPRTAAFAREKKTAVETLNTPLPLRHADESDMRSQAGRSRPGSPANAPAVAGVKSAVTGTAPRASGRIIDEDYDEGAADALMGLAGYKGTKEANGTSYIPIARAVSEARTEATPAPKKLEASQGHKRAISSTEDAVDSDAKKARLGSPQREKAKSVESPLPAKAAVEPAPAVETPAAVPEPVAEMTKEVTAAPAEAEQVVKALSPKSPEPGVITEAVSGDSIAVQGPPAVSEAEKPKEKTPPAAEVVERPAVADSSATVDKAGDPAPEAPATESTTPPSKSAEESSATPMEVETK